MSSPEPAGDRKRIVRGQFSSAANAYVESAILAEGPELARMVELAQLTGDERVLDVATGGGHTALAFARVAREVVATDLTPAMLEAARRHLTARGVANVRFELADAEDLPFGDSEFDIVTSRFAPHHFPEPAGFLREVARVLRPERRLVMFDNMAPEDPELDAFMNRFEVWRDSSHFRAHRPAEWATMLSSAGLAVETVEPLVRRRYGFVEWTGRMNMPRLDRDALEGWLLKAPRRCAEFFEIEVEAGRVVSLQATFGMIAARKSG